MSAEGVGRAISSNYGPEPGSWYIQTATGTVKVNLRMSTKGGVQTTLAKVCYHSQRVALLIERAGCGSSICATTLGAKTAEGSKVFRDGGSFSASYMLIS